MARPEQIAVSAVIGGGAAALVGFIIKEMGADWVNPWIWAVGGAAGAGVSRAKR